MAKRRLKTRTATKTQSPSQDKRRTEATSKHLLNPDEDKPPKVFILPKEQSTEARLVSLPDPATGKTHRYFLDPERGLYEFTRVAAPKKACTSWLLTPDQSQEAAKETGDSDSKSHSHSNEDGYVLQAPDLFLATPIDPLFLLLPALYTPGASEQDWAAFHDRLFHRQDGAYEHLRSTICADSGSELARKMEERMRAVSDTIEIGEDTTYKLNIDKLAILLADKAQRMVHAGLPTSMEQHFVKSKLELPELSMRREQSSVSMVDESAEAIPWRREESQDSGYTSQEKAIEHTDSLVVESKPAKSASGNPKVARLLRLRTTLTYLTTNYTPASLAQKLQEAFAKLVDFTPLDEHLARIAKLKSEAQALRSISDNISRKRGLLDDEEALEKADAKRRKNEEEEAKKRNMSQGVKKLMKADTSGMKKLSSFFCKAPANKG